MNLNQIRNYQQYQSDWRPEINTKEDVLKYLTSAGGSIFDHTIVTLLQRSPENVRKELLSNKNFMLNACALNPDFACLVEGELENDKEFWKSVIRLQTVKNGMDAENVFRHIPENLRKNKDFLLDFTCAAIDASFFDYVVRRQGVQIDQIKKDHPKSAYGGFTFIPSSARQTKEAVDIEDDLDEYMKSLTGKFSHNSKFDWGRE